MARSRGSRRGYIATAQAFDEEMRERIARHQRDRGHEFVTIEEPFDLVRAIEESATQFDVVVVDCLTLWLSNLMLAGRDGLHVEYGRAAQALMTASIPMIVVTNEVGLGIVPDNELARRFRDESGRMNQVMAEAATEVHWIMFGIAMRIK